MYSTCYVMTSMRPHTQRLVSIGLRCWMPLWNLYLLSNCSAACKAVHCCHYNNFVFPSCRASFSKLEEWLENLLMHLDIGLPLLSELEQLRKAFWLVHNHQAPSDNRDDTLNSHEETPSEQPQRQSPDPDSANNNTEQSQDPNSSPEGHSDGQQQQPNNHDTRTENNHCCLNTESMNDAQHKSQCCRSVNTDLSSETYEHKNPSGQAKVRHSPSPPLQVSSSLQGKSNRLRRTSKVLWDRSTEDSSFL